MARLRDGRTPQKPRGDLLLLQAWERWRLALDAAGRSPATLTMYGAALRSFAAACDNPPLNTLTPDDVRRYMVGLRDAGRTPGTRRGYHTVLAAFGHWAETEGMLKRSFVAGVARPAVPETEPEGFSMDELRRLLAICDRRTPLGARNAALLLTLTATGLRAAELMQLRRADVMQDGVEILLRVLGKGSRERVVPLQRPAREAIATYLLRRGEDDDPALWLGTRGPLTTDGLRALCYVLGRAAGVANCHPHRFRNTALSLMLDAGMDRTDVQRLSGHRQVSQLQHYVGYSAQRRAGIALIEASPLEKAGMGQQGKRRR